MVIMRQKYQKKGALLAALISVNLLWGGTVQAQEKLEEFNLDEIIVTATRTEMSLKDTPSAVEVVRRQQLEKVQAKTLRDALKNAVGVNIFNDFQGRSNVSIRGSDSRHVLIMVDGRRLGGELSYNSANAWDVDRIRMDDVERVEIIRGPAGALYGSDAIGGVINVITRKPDKNTGTLNYEYGFYDDGKAVGPDLNLYYQGVNDRLSYKFSAGVQNTKPYIDPAGSGVEMNFYGKDRPFSAGFAYALENGNTVSLDVNKLFEENEKTGSSYTAMGSMKLKTETTTQNDNTRTDFAISYSGFDANQNWQIRAYQSIYDKKYTTIKKNTIIMGSGITRPGTSTTKVDTVKRKLSVIEGHDSWHAGDGHYMTAGFEWRRDDSDGTRLKKKGTPLPDPGSADSARDQAAIDYSALYVQDEYRPNEKWLIIPSVRYDWSDKFSSEVTGRLAATYNAAEDVRVKAVIGQGYKTPTVNELYHFWEMYAGNSGGNGQFFEGNPDLEPEKSLSYELAIEKDWGDTATVHLGVFRNEVKDLINSYWTGRTTAQDPTAYPGLGNDDIMTYKNVPKATLQGIELYGSYKIAKDLFLNAGYTYLDAEDETERKRLTDRPRHQATFGVSYQPPNMYAWDCSIDLVANFDYYYRDSERSTMGNSFYSTKDFTIVNIMTQKKLTEDLKLYLGIDNIGNHQNFGAYADGNLGRVYRIGLQQKF